MVEVGKTYWFEWHGKLIRGKVTKIYNNVIYFV